MKASELPPSVEVAPEQAPGNRLTEWLRGEGHDTVARKIETATAVDPAVLAPEIHGRILMRDFERANAHLGEPERQAAALSFDDSRNRIDSAAPGTR